MSKKIYCFTHWDLDGAVTYLVVKWVFAGYDIEYTATTGFDMRQDITQWLLKHNFSDYERVFFLDLDTSSIIDLIDHKNVLIIDHHKSHSDNNQYKNAAPIIKEYSSAALLAYRVFKKLYDIKFNDAQKTLIIYANDYDSYTHEFKESKMLNAIFWNTQKTFDIFVKNYNNGFVPFTKEQLAIYKIYENEVIHLLRNLKLYQGVHADVDGEYRNVIATFAEKHINDITEYLLNKYEADVAIVVNLKTKHISFRRPKNGTMRLDVFAKDIANGGGHEFSSGGIITDVFLEFTKTLKPI